jgi:Integrase core domain/Recombinase zinc beta ribbon domain
VGDCFDNAMVESFFASLECELLAQRRFRTHDEARAAVFEWIEIFYNRQRRHSSPRRHLGPHKVNRPRNQGYSRVRMRIRPETDEKCVTIAIPALVTPEVWQRVQQTVKSRQLEAREGMVDEPLLNKGIAVCGVCGARMTIKRNCVKNRVYMCSRRATTEMDASKVCPGKYFAVLASKVDKDTWNRVKELIRDDERFQRLIQSKSGELAEQHAEAAQRAEMIARELADMRATQATVYGHMTRETDLTIYAMHRTELQKLNESIAGLEKRATEAQSQVDSTGQHQYAHKQLLELVAQSVARFKADPASFMADAKQRHAALLPDTPSALQDGFIAGMAMGRQSRGLPFDATEVIQLADDVSLDSLSREQKRSILHVLDVTVPMYPVNSEFARTHEHRWDFHFSDGTLRTVSARESCRCLSEAGYLETRSLLGTYTPPSPPWTTR